MFPSGILVRTELDNLVSSLPESMLYHGPPRLTVEQRTEGPHPGDQAVLEIGQWSVKWCLIEITGTQDVSALVVESLIDREPVFEVLSCYYHPETNDYSYALYRDGLAVETFESRGPSIETVNFTSELRRVPLQHLLKASQFMNESMLHFGIDPVSRIVPETGKVFFHVGFPVKRTFWQALLGSVSQR